ncbi:hypothetical protein YG12_22610 [Salmonella enterica subsp. enterica serovar Derby]|uniref:DUF4760 domain-containing protein n=1 Tax=Salmonella derby TaxID=28144 RepID=A0A5W7ZCY5_SALDE|nr:hypothetical protein [Salmonella enterica]EAA4008401.1 hypothetical protein [Salmonella enterica subsp. enterica serovar Give]EAR5283374.1 hypothetical protein [Salmonella enterica subsp. enterica serovar Livingstone]EBQ9852937.1 hypothetical protein [Salmonella enterica subsp. enterica serovar Poona]ECC3926155.1 hypothetical protein [Salmonella enterica subsp. enterica]ECN3110204.1 hypothetical protein [Salmonella enterica subsp. enterica serovar Enteritidis]EDU1644778.1 hypothetical prot
MMDWNMLSAIGACGSAIASLWALCYARKALNTWNRQEQFKVKLEFKRALLELEDAFEAMPDNWNSTQYRIARTRVGQQYNAVVHRVDDAAQLYFKKENLKSAYQNAVRAWVLCEGGIKDKSIHAEWKQLRTDYSQYILTGGNKNCYLSKIEKIYSRIVVFID